MHGQGQGRPAEVLRFKQRLAGSEGVSQAAFEGEECFRQKSQSKGLKVGLASCVQGTVGETAKGEKRSNPKIRRQ